MKTTIEIYERKTGKVVETKELNNLRGFMVYWRSQCNDKDYNYRFANPVVEKAKEIRDSHTIEL